MLWIAVITGIFLLEYHIKKYMDRALALDEQQPRLGGRLILKKYYNTGAAGNWMSRRPKAMRCVHIVVLGLTAAMLAAAAPAKHSAAAKTGLSFLAGGGFSNLHDRMTKGHVVDYFSFGFGPQKFRKLVFNAADLFIFAGSLLCMAHMIGKDLQNITSNKSKGSYTR